MKTLKVKHMGDVVQGIRLRGDKRNPEPESVRIAFPGGDVDVVRTTDGEYWVHVRVDSAEDAKASGGERVIGKLVDARLDVRSKHASECDAGDFAHPDLYHLAVRIARDRVAVLPQSETAKERRAREKLIRGAIKAEEQLGIQELDGG